MSKTKEKIELEILALRQTLGDFEIEQRNLKWWQFSQSRYLQSQINYYEEQIEELEDELQDAPGMTGPLVDLFESQLTEEEWHALHVVHLMRLRLNVGIRFDWSRSIDVKGHGTSQIIDQDVIFRNCIMDEEEQ